MQRATRTALFLNASSLDAFRLAPRLLFGCDLRFTIHFLQNFRVNLDSPYKILHTPVKPRTTISASYALAHQNCLFGEHYASLFESPAPDFCSRGVKFVH